MGFSLPLLSWLLPATTTPEGVVSTASLTVAISAKITLDLLMLITIAKANVDFALSAMLPPKLLSPDADTAKMELRSALRLATWERNIVALVLRLVACNWNKKKNLIGKKKKKKKKKS